MEEILQDDVPEPRWPPMRSDLPLARAGQTVGLLGGSFDPPHAGHVHITRQALRQFGLDRVWWLVSPGNPLKSEGPAPLDRRMDRARVVMQHPRVDITDIEARREESSPIISPTLSSGTTMSTFIIGSRSTGLAFITPCLKAIEPATRNAISLESFSW